MRCGRVIRCYHRCGEGQVWIQIRVVEVAVVPDDRDYGAHNNTHVLRRKWFGPYTLIRQAYTNNPDVILIRDKQTEKE